MSRTIRRKNEVKEYAWLLTEWVSSPSKTDRVPQDFDKVVRDTWGGFKVVYLPTSKTAKLKIAKFHADGGSYYNGGNGPGWFLNLYCQKPYRQDSRVKIQKYLLDTEFEPIISSKPKRVYWD